MGKLDSMYYVYKHYLNDKLFYIGKGCGDRAYDFKGRSSSWIKLVAGNFDNIRVEIVGYFESELNAYEIEKLLIKKYNTEGAKLTNHVYNPVKGDLLKEALNMKSESEPLIINGRSSYKKFFDYGERYSPLNALESIENLNEGVSIFIDSASNFLTKIKDELVVGGYTPLLVMPESKYIDKPSKVEEKDMFEFRTRGVISNKYNCVVVDSCFIDEIEINLKKVNAVIINTTSIRNRNKALLSFNGQADFLICKTKESSKVSYNLPSSIVDKYLNTPLTVESKSELSSELNLINNRGEQLKWVSIKNVLITKGYKVEDKSLRIEGKRRRTSIISTVNNCKIDKALMNSNRKKNFLMSKEVLMSKTECYLNIPLTAEDKEKLSKELNLLNKRKEVAKWVSIKKVLIEEGYSIADKTATIDGKRRRVSVISEP